LYTNATLDASLLKASAGLQKKPAGGGNLATLERHPPKRRPSFVPDKLRLTLCAVCRYYPAGLMKPFFRTGFSPDHVSTEECII
jgi:hypothetical protein